MKTMERMRRINTIHFVGIGGSGMGGIAEVLLNLGYSVQGSDLKPNAVTTRLAGLGARIFQGHDASHVTGADVVVVSTAVSASAAALAGFSFLGADFSSAMGVSGYAVSFALVTPTVLRGPLRVRALVLVRWPRTGRLRR